MAQAKFSLLNTKRKTSMREIGLMEKCMDQEDSFIRMDQFIKVTLSKVEKKDKANLLFQIKPIIKDIGAVANKMGLGHFTIKIAKW